ncbi:MAG: urate hydroxylase PuuD, partial [Deltaproteobacteria bacterium]|nr:urate hydroxylase PuuD [Deltaproteobacteria bacterium]
MPDPHLVDWTAMILRWFHLVTGAAWIGASFYFVWLNNHVRPVDSGDGTPGLSGEVFAIHGGAFYRVSKFGGAPEKLPSVLHWFKWEAYL